MRQRTMSLFMHQFDQTPIVVSVWIDELACRKKARMQVFTAYSAL